MKGRKWKVSLLLLAVTLLVAGIGAACAQTGDPLSLSASEVTLEAYDDYQLSVEGVTGEVAWSSSDESIATVSADGVVSCLGKTGDVTITADADGRSGSCAVRVVDSGLTPRLMGEAQTAYVNGITVPDVYIRYNDREYTNFKISTVTVADPSLATEEDGGIRGIAEGETTVEITVLWKGLTVSARSAFDLTILPEYVVTTDASTYTVYDVNENSPVKSRTAEIGATLFVRGRETKAEFSVTGDGLGTLYTADGLTVTAGDIARTSQTTLTVTAQAEGKSASAQVTLVLCPAYDLRPLTEFSVANSGAGGAVYEPSEETVAQRTGVYRYYTGEDCANEGNDWIKWGNQIELQSLKTLNSTSAYQNIVVEDGVVLVSFDVYYAGQTVNDARQYRGVNFNAQYGPYSSDSVYYIDHAKNMPERLIVNNGVLTNTLPAETWVTFFVDLRELDAYSQIDTYLCSSRAGDTTYIDNVRFWFDDSALENVDRSGADTAQRTLTQNAENAARYNAPENEFIVYSPAFTSLVKTEATDTEEAYYTYKSLAPAGSGWQNWIRSQRKITPWQVYYGNAAAQELRWFSFDYRYVAGAPKLFAYDSTLTSSEARTVSLRGVVENPNIFVFQDGKRIKAIPDNEWVSIVVAINPGASAYDTLYLSCDDAAASPATQFDVRNCNYWTDSSWRYDSGYGYDNLLEVQASNYDYAIDGTAMSLADFLRVTWRGKSVTGYTVSDFTGADFVSYDPEEGELIISPAAESGGAMREADISFTVSYGEGEHKESVACVMHVVAYPMDTLIVNQSEYSVYCGTNEEFASERTAELGVNTLIVDGEPVSASEVAARIVSGEEYIILDGMTVTGVSAGTAVVELYYTKAGGEEITSRISIHVHNGSFVAEWAEYEKEDPNAILFEEVDGIGGRDGVMHYAINGDIWNNSIVLAETQHTGVGGTMTTAEAMNNMYAKNYNYIAFDFYLTAGTTIRIAGPSGTAYANLVIAAGSAPTAVTSAGEVRLPATIYNEYGVALAEDAVIAADAWYTVVFQYNRSASSGQWACVRILNTAGSGTYLDRTLYGYDAASVTPEVSTELVADIPANVTGTWNGTAYIPVAAYVAGEPVEASIEYKVSDASAATCVSGVVTFLKNEAVSVTVTVSYDGQNVQGTVTATPAAVTSQTASEAWGMRGSDFTFVVNEETGFGTFTLSTSIWNSYICLKECDGYWGTNPELSSTAEAIAHMRENNYNVIVFKVKVTSGTARIYAPTTGNAQSYVSISNTYVPQAGIEDYIMVYDANGNALTSGASTPYGTEYTVVIHYNVNNAMTGGYGEICIKGQACVVEVGGVSFYSA